MYRQRQNDNGIGVDHCVHESKKTSKDLALGKDCTSIPDPFYPSHKNRGFVFWQKGMVLPRLQRQLCLQSETVIYLCIYHCFFMSRDSVELTKREGEYEGKCPQLLQNIIIHLLYKKKKLFKYHIGFSFVGRQ